MLSHTDLNQIISKHQLNQFAYAPLKRPVHIDFYKQWLADHNHADMAYLEQHLPQKESLNSSFKSIISLTQNYLPHPSPKETFKQLKIAKYAQGEDYHYWLKDKLKKICNELKELFPKEVFTPYVDSGPVIERDHANQLGLGWYGKNTCLMNRKDGSYFFISEILTSMPLKASIAPHSKNFCGTCTKCIDACPTNALDNNYTLNSNLCISYLNIENKKNPSIELREKIGSWFFGCDICQDVCPWNQKNYVTQLAHNDNPADKNMLAEEIELILTSSNKKIMRLLNGSPLLRAGGNGLKRNALIVATNNNLIQLIPQIKGYLEHEKLGDLALWSLEKLDSNKQ